MKTRMLIAVSILLITSSACNIASNTSPTSDPLSTLPETTAPAQTTQETTKESTQSYPGESTELIVTEAYPSTMDTKEELSAYPAASGDNTGAISDKPILHTELGDLLIASSRLANEANNETVKPGEKILLIVLSKPNQENLTPENFSLEAFHDKKEPVYLFLNGQAFEPNLVAMNTMGGWIDGEFVIGFPVPDSTESYQLVWEGNDPVDIFPTE